ncbi:hypothetical protein BU17DRAFT_44649 [Hysterangium stoloniferum]|nr:hypothetical protein BU17DRAFT_44649 [Hysterangium stoloniferum]
MSFSPTSSSSSSSPDRTAPKDCFSCRLISTLTLVGLGIHALRQTRPVAPGSRTSKRILGLVGLGECFFSFFFLGEGWLAGD